MAKCPDCDGTIGLFGNGDGKCSECRGSGENPFILDEMAEALGSEPKECHNCNGTGDCPTCGGTGEIESDDY